MIDDVDLICCSYKVYRNLAFRGNDMSDKNDTEVITACSLNRPVDADGIPIDIGDTVYDIHLKHKYKVTGISKKSIWCEERGGWIDSCFVSHKYPDSYKKIIIEAINKGVKWGQNKVDYYYVNKLVERCEKVAHMCDHKKCDCNRSGE